ncbi:MAG: winged helix-turn-helix transcriptional regulator [Solirubrobacteraceae bacterium]
MIELAPGETIKKCAARQALVLISNKWTPLVVFVLSGGSHRFSELLRRIEGVSHKMLTQTLRDLERTNCVQRTVIPSAPVAVEYSLTELGRTLVEPLRGIIEWANEHAADAGFVEADGGNQQGAERE